MFSAPPFLYPPSPTAGALARRCTALNVLELLLLCLCRGVPARAKCAEVSQRLRVDLLRDSSAVTAAPHRRLYKAEGAAIGPPHSLTRRGSDFQSRVSSSPKMCLRADSQRPFFKFFGSSLQESELKQTHAIERSIFYDVTRGGPSRSPLQSGVCGALGVPAWERLSKASLSGGG